MTGMTSHRVRVPELGETATWRCIVELLWVTWTSQQENEAPLINLTYATEKSEADHSSLQQAYRRHRFKESKTKINNQKLVNVILRQAKPQGRFSKNLSMVWKMKTNGIVDFINRNISLKNIEVFFFYMSALLDPNWSTPCKQKFLLKKKKFLLCISALFNLTWSIRCNVCHFTIQRTQLN